MEFGGIIIYMEITNQAAIAEEEALTRGFTPPQAIIYDNLAVPEHLTLVADCDSDLQQTLSSYVTELREADSTKSLSFTPIENFHMTVWHPVSEDRIEAARKVVTAALEADPIRMDVYGMHIHPNGIALNCYSPGGKLAWLRSALAEATGSDFDPESRLANIGWITIARFVSTPSEELVAHVVDHLKTSFGVLDLADNVHLYRATHRQLLGAQKIW